MVDERDGEIVRLMFALRRTLGFDRWPDDETRDRVEAWVRINCLTYDNSLRIYAQGRNAGREAQKARAKKADPMQWPNVS